MKKVVQTIKQRRDGMLKRFDPKSANGLIESITTSFRPPG